MGERVQRALLPLHSRASDECTVHVGLSHNTAVKWLHDTIYNVHGPHMDGVLFTENLWIRESDDPFNLMEPAN